MIKKIVSLCMGILISTQASSIALDKNKLHDSVVQAYIFAYPLVLMETTKKVTTNVARPIDKGNKFQAPVNQLVNVSVFPDANFKDVVRPNADTLYTSAFLDLNKEPMVLSVPDMHDRYYLMPMLSGWTDIFASPGTRTTGNKAQSFLITGPFWKGKMPEGMTEIKSPTNLVWLLGRTQTNGVSDYEVVHAIQKEYKLVPLSAWGKNYIPPKGHVLSSINTKKAPSIQVQQLSAVAYFTLFSKLLKDNPLTKEDAPMKEVLAQIGLEQGKEFNAGILSSEQINTFNKAITQAQHKIAENVQTSGKRINGWQYFPIVGTYGTHYLDRASVAFAGLGANIPEDALYPTAFRDEQNNLLNGTNNYIIHFSKGKLPPVNGFWSLSMYDKNSFFVTNSINRYALGDRDKLKFNSDGSLDIYIQKASPGKDKEANWLPAPEGTFNVTLRLYWPKEEVLKNKWVMPGIQKVL